MTYKSHEGRKRNNIIILIPVIIAVAVVGYFVLQTYGTPQNIQNEASKTFNNTGSTIQRISLQGQQSIANLQNSITSSTNENNRVPIAVYDFCYTSLYPDQTVIYSSCGPATSNKSFKFNMPDALIQLQKTSDMSQMRSKVYQYGANDFKIGLYDNVGEKNYTVTLWQLP